MPTRTAPEIELPPDAATADDHRNPSRRRRDRDEEEPAPDVGHLVQPEPRHDLDKMILHPEVKTDILAGLRALEIRADLDRIWNLSSIQPQQGRCILNFYGPPGTGKTRAAATSLRRDSCCCTKARALSPVTASMRRTPAATPASATILN